MSGIKECQDCRESINILANKCVHCGYIQSPLRRVLKNVVITLSGMSVVFGVLATGINSLYDLRKSSAKPDLSIEYIRSPNLNDIGLDVVNRSYADTNISRLMFSLEGPWKSLNYSVSVPVNKNIPSETVFSLNLSLKNDVFGKLRSNKKQWRLIVNKGPEKNQVLFEKGAKLSNLPVNREILKEFELASEVRQCISYRAFKETNPNFPSNLIEHSWPMKVTATYYDDEKFSELVVSDIRALVYVNISCIDRNKTGDI